MIKLEPFSKSDFDRFISWIDSKELLITIAGPLFSYPLTVGQLETYFETKNSYPFNIVDQSEGKTIGHAEIALSGKNTFKIDKLIIGDQSNRGKGIGQKVINELLAYSFIKFHAQTVELNVFDWNIAGIRCYEKCGFIINPSKSMSFQLGDKNWIALNMTIDKDVWEKRQLTT